MPINVTKKFVFEHDDPAVVATVMENMLSVMFPYRANNDYRLLHCKGEKDFLFDDGRYGQDTDVPYGERKPTRMWLATYSDYKTRFRPDEGDREFKTYEQMSTHALGLMNDVTIEDMWDTIGDGYDDCFMRSDGTITLGYRISHRPSGGWNLLDLSIVHMYYGK